MKKNSVKFATQLNQTIEQLIANPKALFAISHSGGKDSQAQYSVIKKLVPAERIVVIHADLGEMEWEGTLDHVKKYVTHELRVIKSPNLLALVEQRKMWPDSRIRYCQMWLKTDLITELIVEIAKERGFEYIVNCLGIRADESDARKKKKPLEFNAKKSAPTKGRFIFDWHPILDWSTREVFRFIKDNGEVPHEAYVKGMSRLSCRFCVLANKQDLKLSSELNPELFEKYVALEIKIGHTIKLHKKKPISLRDWLNLPTKRKGKEVTRFSDCG